MSLSNDLDDQPKMKRKFSHILLYLMRFNRCQAD